MGLSSLQSLFFDNNKPFYRGIAFLVLLSFISCASVIGYSEKTRKRADNYYKYGTKFLSARKLELAKEQFARALLLVKDDTRVYEGLGLVYMLEGDYQYSLAMFDKAVMYLDKYKKSLKKTNPLDYNKKWRAYAGEVYNNRSAALNQLSRWSEAVSAAKKGLEYKDSYRTPELLYYQMGLAYLADKKFSEALDSFSNMILLNPFIPDAYYYKALSYSKLERPSDAIKGYEKALELYSNLSKNSPDIPAKKAFLRDIHRTLGLLYYGIGNKVDAVRHMESAYEYAEGTEESESIKNYIELFK